MACSRSFSPAATASERFLGGDRLGPIAPVARLGGGAAVATAIGARPAINPSTRVRSAASNVRALSLSTAPLSPTRGPDSAALGAGRN